MSDYEGPLDVQLKWKKETFSLTLPDRRAATLRARVLDVTGVPVVRQKLLSKAWKGTLLDDEVIMAPNTHKPLVVTLIGSAETLVEPTPTAFEAKTNESSPPKESDSNKNSTIIPALQLPWEYREDGKQEWYSYNHLVQGLPQLEIEKLLAKQQFFTPESSTTTARLHGTVALQMGLGLQRAYVNDIAVLNDGTIVSVRDDGHVQGWKHARQVWDVRTNGQPITSVVALSSGQLATAGSNGVQLWQHNAQDDRITPVATLPSLVPGTAPDGLVQTMLRSANNIDDNNLLVLAARTRVTYQADPNQFRLPPQTEAQRQARAQAEAQAEALQQALRQAAASVSVWVQNNGQDNNNNHYPPSRQVLVPPDGSLVPVTALTFWSTTANGTTVLAVGDAGGGLRIWRYQAQRWVPGAYWRLQTAEGTRVRIVAMNSLPATGLLAVSTDTTLDSVVVDDAETLTMTHARAVCTWQWDDTARPRLVATLTGHAGDAVTCLCPLPNGDLLTAGGKLDATLQLWSRAQLSAVGVHATATQRLPKDVGYVFALVVLSSGTDQDTSYAVAAARYNLIKIIV